MSTSHAAKIPMRIQNREEKSGFYSILNSLGYLLCSRLSLYDSEASLSSFVEVIWIISFHFHDFHNENGMIGYYMIFDWTLH